MKPSAKIKFEKRDNCFYNGQHRIVLSKRLIRLLDARDAEQFIEVKLSTPRAGSWDDTSVPSKVQLRRVHGLWNRWVTTYNDKFVVIELDSNLARFIIKNIGSSVCCELIERG